MGKLGSLCRLYYRTVLSSIWSSVRTFFGGDVGRIVGRSKFISGIEIRIGLFIGLSPGYNTESCALHLFYHRLFLLTLVKVCIFVPH